MTQHQEPLNDKDLAWIRQRRDLNAAEESVEGITNSEVLWGGPRGKGVVYVVEDLVKVTGNLVQSVTQLREAETARAAHEQALEAQRRKFWGVARWLGVWIGTPSVFITALRTVYVTAQPILNAYGAHLPPLPTGAHLTP